MNSATQETRNKKQETRNKKQETRNKKQETRNKKQEIVFIGNVYGFHDGYDGSVFSVHAICPTLTVHGVRHIMTCGENKYV